MADVRVSERDALDAAPRRSLARHQIEPIAGPKDDLDNPVLEVRDLLPLAPRRPHEVFEFAAVAELRRDQGVTRAIVDFDLRFGYAGKTLAQFVLVGGRRRPQLVEIDLLVEIEVGRRPFSGVRMPRVEESTAFAVPGQVAAGRPRVDAGDDFAG